VSEKIERLLGLVKNHVLIAVFTKA